MAINKNHEFDELDGVKCAIVERNASRDRVDFLRSLLAFNGYTVIAVASPPPKTAPAPKAPEGEQEPPSPPVPDTFTIGITDVTFNPTNAIFGRLLRTQRGHIVTLAYWHQQEEQSHDEVPYYEKTL